MLSKYLKSIKMYVKRSLNIFLQNMKYARHELVHCNKGHTFSFLDNYSQTLLPFCKRQFDISYKGGKTQIRELDEGARGAWKNSVRKQQQALTLLLSAGTTDSSQYGVNRVHITHHTQATL